MFGMLVFFTNLGLLEFRVRYVALFLLFSVIDGFEWFWMGSLFKNIQLMLEFLKVSFLVLHFSWHTLRPSWWCYLWYCYYADNTTLYSKGDLASDLWQQLELAAELESDLWDTVDWGKKWLVDFNVGKNQLVSFEQSNNIGSTNVKMVGAYTLSLLLKLPLRKLGP